MGRHVESVGKQTMSNPCTVPMMAEVDTGHDIEQEATNGYQMDTVNINSISFNTALLVIEAKLKISSNQNNINIPYKISAASDGNIMPIHIFKILLPRLMKEQLVVRTNNRSIVLNMYTFTIRHM